MSVCVCVRAHACVSHVDVFCRTTLADLVKDRVLVAKIVR